MFYIYIYIDKRSKEERIGLSFSVIVKLSFPFCSLTLFLKIYSGTVSGFSS